MRYQTALNAVIFWWRKRDSNSLNGKVTDLQSAATRHRCRSSIVIDRTYTSELSISFDSLLPVGLWLSITVLSLRVELTKPCGWQILSLLRIPVSPQEHLVRRERLELSLFSEADFESAASTISPPTHILPT